MLVERKPYRYFGNGECSGSFGELNRFGQEIKLADQDALDVINAGAGILTSEQFVLIFTADDAKKRSARSGTQFMERHCKGLEGMEILRNHLHEKIRSQIEDNHV
jgi:hypothetical protein